MSDQKVYNYDKCKDNALLFIRWAYFARLIQKIAIQIRLKPRK